MLGTLPPYKRGGVPCANARKRLRALFAPVTCGGGACKTCPQALCSNKRCPGTVQSATVVRLHLSGPWLAARRCGTPAGRSTSAWAGLAGSASSAATTTSTSS
eukprot:474819-Prorocentrum_minimum.AAC.1